MQVRSLIKRVGWGMVVGMLVVVWVGCASPSPQTEALRLLTADQPDAAVKLLDEAVQADPQNVALRAEQARVRDLAVNHYLMQAQARRATDDMDGARTTYLKLLALDPANARAQQGLQALEAEARHRNVYREALAQMEAGDEDGARQSLQIIVRENPQQREARAALRSLDERSARRQASEPRLAVDLQKVVSFDLRDATLRAAFEFVTKASGLNVFFDKVIKTDQRVSVYAKDTTLEQLVQLILVTQQLERKVVGPNAILVYPATPQKIREHQDLISRTFYLANADVKQVQNLVRTMVKTKDLYVDEKLNMLVMRDTPEAVRYAEKLIAAHDLAEPEVMLQVEVMEISRNRLSELGLRFPEQMALTPAGAANTPGVLPLSNLRDLNAGMVQFTISNPSIVLNLKNQEGLTNLLANPRIRVKNREKARILIGDRVPVITSTSTSTGFVAESVNYLDVGIRLEVEPNVFLEDEVQIKVGLEVSNIAREIRGATGTLTYQVGTRNANTTLRLRDGETQVLAGLISDEDRGATARLPGLGELPVAGRLFSSTAQTRNKTEIVLLITPRVLRSIQRPDAAVSEFYAGTESAIGARPLFLRKVAESAAPSAPTPAPAPVPALTSAVTPTAEALVPAPAPAPAPAQSVPAVTSGAAAPLGTMPPGVTPPSATPTVDPTMPVGASTVGLRFSGPTQVRQGEVFEIAVQLSTLKPTVSASMLVQFDPALVQWEQAQSGGFFEREGAHAVVNALPTAAGAVLLTVSADPAKGMSGQENVVVLRLRAVGTPGHATDSVRIGLISANVTGESAVSLPMPLPAPWIVKVVP